MPNQLVDTWNIHNRINLYLLDAIDKSSIASHSASKGRSVGEQFAHIHNVRLMWLKSAGPELLKGLQNTTDASRAPVLKFAFQKHLSETEDQVERLKEAFTLLDVSAKPKPCKGMAGLLAEGTEVIAEAEDKYDIAADLNYFTF